MRLLTGRSMPAADASAARVRRMLTTRGLASGIARQAVHGVAHDSEEGRP